MGSTPRSGSVGSTPRLAGREMSIDPILTGIFWGKDGIVLDGRFDTFGRYGSGLERRLADRGGLILCLMRLLTLSICG